MVSVLFLGQMYHIVPGTSVHGGMKWNDGGRATAWSCRQACDVMETCVTTAYVIITAYVILTACVIKN